MIMNGETEWVLIRLQGFSPNCMHKTAFGPRSKIMPNYENDHVFYSTLNTSYGLMDQYVHKEDEEYLRNMNCR